MASPSETAPALVNLIIVINYSNTHKSVHARAASTPPHTLGQRMKQRAWPQGNFAERLSDSDVCQRAHAENTRHLEGLNAFDLFSNTSNSFVRRQKLAYCNAYCAGRALLFASQ